jgi:uncharacterized protein (TIGR02466 family)
MNITNYALFPTIVTEVECDLFKYIQGDLTRWIYNYHSKNESVIISNRGGWQSPSDFYNDPSFSEFAEYIVRNANHALCHYTRQFRLNNMWININKRGDYNVAHDHPNSTISGVFWIKTPKNCGNFVFRNPQFFVENLLIQFADKNVQKEQNYYLNYNFEPKEGKMILFASHLLHGVEENQSNEDRISIAFNLDIV